MNPGAQKTDKLYLLRSARIHKCLIPFRISCLHGSLGSSFALHAEEKKLIRKQRVRPTLLRPAGNLVSRVSSSSRHTKRGRGGDPGYEVGRRDIVRYSHFGKDCDLAHLLSGKK